MNNTLKSDSSNFCKLCGGHSALLHNDLTDRLAGTAGHWSIRHCTQHACGLAWIDPAPTPEQLSAAYEHYYTHDGTVGRSWLRRRYDRLRLAYLGFRFGYAIHDLKPWETLGGRLLGCLPHRRAAFDASVMWLPATPGGRVLEIGCGNGHLLTRLEHLGWQVEGLEPDPKAAAIAVSRGLRITNSEFTEQTFAPGTFDAIVMSHVIEHIGDPVTLLRRCRKILKPGGVLVMLTPNLNAPGHRWFGRDWLHLDPPRHLNLFTREAALNTCRQAGFLHTACTTTLRDANWTLAASVALRRSGKYRIGELSRPLRMLGLILLYIEWTGLKLKLCEAEELLVIAHNSPE